MPLESYRETHVDNYGRQCYDITCTCGRVFARNAPAIMIVTCPDCGDTFNGFYKKEWHRILDIFLSPIVLFMMLMLLIVGTVPIWGQ